ncbi:MAG: branched-chain amino acid transport system ATP-binding protein [Alphaproteobacteria bacterium]|jgi:branched-chain amino acid transport system ATP-binding protein
MSAKTMEHGAAPASGDGGSAFFSCRGLQSYYGDSYIVQNVSFDIPEGQILALLGRNGAGKTSTLRSIARASTPELRSGEVYLGGVALHGKANYVAAQAGVQLVQEDRRIIQGLTVEENLQLAQISGEKGWSFERIFELFPRLAERRKQEGTTMSGGEQQMLAIARALARDVKLLLLDEPYEGLAPVVRQDIAKALNEVRSAGITSIIVEQHAEAALKISDRAVILDTGEVVYDGSAQHVLDNEDLMHKYLAI